MVAALNQRSMTIVDSIGSSDRTRALPTELTEASEPIQNVRRNNIITNPVPCT